MGDHDGKFPLPSWPFGTATVVSAFDAWSGVRQRINKARLERQCDISYAWSEFLYNRQFAHGVSVSCSITRDTYVSNLLLHIQNICLLGLISYSYYLRERVSKAPS